MTELAIRRSTVDIMSATNRKELLDLASRIVRFAPGNQKLSEADATRLAIYVHMTDLNPFNQECYFSPDMGGPIAGVQGYRRKAKEYIRVHDGGGDYHLSYRLAETHEADFNPDKGDIAWVCILTDDKSMNKWQEMFNKFFTLFIESKMDAEKAYDRAMMVAGPRPEWSAVGVVDHREHFSKAEWENQKPKVDEDGNTVYKPEMWDRNERAKKRAEKGAIKKRYPDLIIPDYAELQDENTDILIRELVAELQKPKDTDPNQLLAELGYDAPASEQVIEPEIIAPSNEILQAVVDAGHSQNKIAAKKVLVQVQGADVSTPEKAVEYMRLYRAWKDSDKSTKEAIGLANAGEKP